MPYTSWKTIAADLDRRIASGELPSGARLPSGEAIAKEWGVNRNTAHRAIEELQRQGLVVRQRGRGTVVAARERPPTGTVALLADCYVPSLNFPSVALIHGLQDGLGENVNVVIAESKSDAETEIRQLERLSQEVDGIVMYCTGHEASIPAIQALADTGYPLVLLDRVPPGVRVDAVTTDNENATAEAVRRLQDSGHENIGFVSFHKPNFSSVVERHAGFLRAMREAGIEEAESFVRWLPLGLSRVPEVYEQVLKDALFSLTQGQRPITALFCVEGSIAVLAIAAGARLGLNVPDDLEIAAFSDWYAHALGSPYHVRRIAQRHYDIGKAAAGLQRERQADPAREPHLVRVPADFDSFDLDLLPTLELIPQ